MEEGSECQRRPLEIDVLDYLTWSGNPHCTQKQITQHRQAISLTLTVCQIIFTGLVRDVGLNLHLIFAKIACDADRSCGRLYQKFHLVVTQGLIYGRFAHFSKRKINAPSNGGLPGI